MSRKPDKSDPLKKGKARRDWKPAFLKALALEASVTKASQVAGINRDTAYSAYGKDEAFAKAWDDAIEESVDDLESVARTRAKDGSDVLLIFMLKAWRPAKYREPKGEINVNIENDRLAADPETAKIAFAAATAHTLKRKEQAS